MSDHVIVYDLQYPQGARFECTAAPDAPCRAVWDCSCETIHKYHVKNGVPHHFSPYGDDEDASWHHVGRFDPGACVMRDWLDNDPESVTGTVRVTVDTSWEGEFYRFEAVSAELANPATRYPEGATS